MTKTLPSLKPAISSLIEQDDFFAANSGRASEAVALIDRSLSPLTLPYIHLSAALAQTDDWSDIDSLPALIREVALEMVKGVSGNLSKVFNLLEERGYQPHSILPTDTDIHPNYHFSGAVSLHSAGRLAFKQRNVDAEIYLANLLNELGLSKFIVVPELCVFSNSFSTQRYVQRFAPSKLSADLLFHLGCFLRLSEELFMNDLHSENVIFDGEALQIVDGETLFQPRIAVARGKNVHEDALCSHLLFHPALDPTAAPGGPVGGIAHLLLQLKKGSNPSQTEILSSIKEGYFSLETAREVILALLPPRLAIRHVALPTAAFSRIVSKLASDDYSSSIAGLEQRITIFLRKHASRNLRRARLSASDLSRCMIPKFEKIIEPQTVATWYSTDPVNPHQRTQRWLEVSARISNLIQQ